MSAAVERTGMGQAALGDAGYEGAAVRGRDMARADGTALLEREVRELVRRRGVDPVAEPQRFAELVREAADDYADRFACGALVELPDMERAVREVSDAVGGLGPLQPYLDDPEIEEIWLNAPTRAANLLLVGSGIWATPVVDGSPCRAAGSGGRADALPQALRRDLVQRVVGVVSNA